MFVFLGLSSELKKNVGGVSGIKIHIFQMQENWSGNLHTQLLSRKF